MKSTEERERSFINCSTLAEQSDKNRALMRDDDPPNRLIIIENDWLAVFPRSILLFFKMPSSTGLVAVLFDDCLNRKFTVDLPH